MSRARSMDCDSPPDPSAEVYTKLARIIQGMYGVGSFSKTKFVGCGSTPDPHSETESS